MQPASNARFATGASVARGAPVPRGTLAALLVSGAILLGAGCERRGGDAEESGPEAGVEALAPPADPPRDAGTDQDPRGEFPPDTRLAPDRPGDTGESGPIAVGGFTVTLRGEALGPGGPTQVRTGEPIPGAVRNPELAPVGPVLTLEAPPGFEARLPLVARLEIPVPGSPAYHRAAALAGFTRDGMTVHIGLEGGVQEPNGRHATFLVDATTWRAVRAALDGDPTRVQLQLVNVKDLVVPKAGERAPDVTWPALDDRERRRAIERTLPASDLRFAAAEPPHGLYELDAEGRWQPVGSLATQSQPPAVVFVHGFGSSPWQAFGSGTKVRSSVMATGAGRALAWFYDSKRSVRETGAELAQTLQAAGYKDVAFIGHSMGTVVSLRAIGELPLSVRVRRAVLLAGPLAGTEVASNGRAALTRIIDSVTETLIGQPASGLLDRYLPSLREMAPGSELLTDTHEKLKARQGITDFITAAGNRASRMGRAIAVLSGLKPEEFDDIIPVHSAKGDVLKDAGHRVTQLGPLPLPHEGFGTQSEVWEAVKGAVLDRGYRLSYKGVTTSPGGSGDSGYAQLIIQFLAGGKPNHFIALGNISTGADITEVVGDPDSGGRKVVGKTYSLSVRANQAEFTLTGLERITGTFTQFFGFSGRAEGGHRVEFTLDHAQ